MKEFDIEERKNRAVDFFMNGYNCAQSVVLAYIDLFDMDTTTAAKISSSFGGGLGRMREVCGAVSGMAMILGLAGKADNPADHAARTENYAAVQDCANTFKEKFGSIICADLLSKKRNVEMPEPSERNAEYYAKRPCAKAVAYAAETLGKYLKEHE
ncbi:MAG: C_GCAxxG_C_C family protein [Paludibacteraceae bacterium]|nr:C_GCAxxG_C_C family protein [Paludibacteraceae bacterium]